MQQTADFCVQTTDALQHQVLSSEPPTIAIPSECGLTHTSTDMGATAGPQALCVRAAGEPPTIAIASQSGITHTSTGMDLTTGSQACHVTRSSAEDSSASARRALQVATAPALSMIHHVPKSGLPITAAGKPVNGIAPGSESEASEKLMRLLVQQLDRFGPHHCFLGRFELLGRSAQRRGGVTSARRFTLFMLPAVGCTVLASGCICYRMNGRGVCAGRPCFGRHTTGVPKKPARLL